MRPRPLYEAETELPPAEVLARVRYALEHEVGTVRGYVGRKHLFLHVGADEQHLWSPHISVELAPYRDGITGLRGYFGPHPHLWGLYTALYAAQSIICLFAGLYGYVSWTLDMPLTGVWVSLTMIVTLMLSCATNIAGEWAGAPQMAVVRDWVAEALALEEVGSVSVGAAGPALDASDASSDPVY